MVGSRAWQRATTTVDLSPYATTSALTSGLAAKADASALTSGLAAKADTSALKFTKSFTSTDQTFTAGALLTLAHGMSVAPKVVQFYAVNVTTEAGYVTGDVLYLQGGADHIGNTTAYGISGVGDATNVLVRIGSAGIVAAIIHKTTGALGSITPANWKLRVVAYA